MPELVIELHVPLEPDKEVAEGEYAFPWIDDLTTPAQDVTVEQ